MASETRRGHSCDYSERSLIALARNPINDTRGVRVMSSRRVLEGSLLAPYYLFRRAPLPINPKVDAFVRNCLYS